MDGDPLWETFSRTTLAHDDGQWRTVEEDRPELLAKQVLSY